MNLVPLKISFVRYIQGDLIGHLLAYVTLAHLYIGSYYATVIAFRRDIQTLFICFGQLLCVGFNLILKNWLKESRPVDQEDFLDYGMPSNHSQFMGYFFVIACSSIFSVPSSKLSLQLKLFYSFVVAIGSLLVCYSRHYLRYHTKQQVIVGFAAGIAFGLFWNILLGSRWVRSVQRRILQLPLAKYLCIRDLDRGCYAAVDDFERDLTLTLKKTN